MHMGSIVGNLSIQVRTSLNLLFVLKRNGYRVLFWHDKWCGEQPLEVQFPNLFKMACLRDATVREVLSCNGCQYHWNTTFTRSPNDWDVEVGNGLGTD